MSKKDWKRELRERGARSRTDGTPEARELDRKIEKVTTELDRVSRLSDAEVLRRERILLAGHLHEPVGREFYGVATGAWWAVCRTCGASIWRHDGNAVWFDSKLRKP